MSKIFPIKEASMGDVGAPWGKYPLYVANLAIICPIFSFNRKLASDIKKPLILP